MYVPQFVCYKVPFRNYASGFQNCMYIICKIPYVPQFGCYILALHTSRKWHMLQWFTTGMSFTFCSLYNILNISVKYSISHEYAHGFVLLCFVVVMWFWIVSSIYLSIYLVVYSLHHKVLPTLQSIPLMTNGPLYPITQDSSCHGQHTMPRNPWSFPMTSSA